MKLLLIQNLLLMSFSGPYPPSWGDPELESLLTSPPSTTSSSPTSKASATSTLSNSVSAASETNTSGLKAAETAHNRNRTAVIAGSVLGTLFGVLLCALLWFLLRRRRFRFGSFNITPDPAAELHGEGPRVELSTGQRLWQILGGARRHEMPDNAAEMPVGRQRVELATEKRPYEIQGESKRQEMPAHTSPRRRGLSRARSRSRGRSKGRRFVELDGGEAAKEIQPVTPAVDPSWSHHIHHVSTGDYFTPPGSRPTARDKPECKSATSEISPLSQSESGGATGSPLVARRPSTQMLPPLQIPPPAMGNHGTGKDGQNPEFRTPGGGMFGIRSPGIRWKKAVPRSPPPPTPPPKSPKSAKPAKHPSPVSPLQTPPKDDIAPSKPRPVSKSTKPVRSPSQMSHATVSSAVGLRKPGQSISSVYSGRE